MDQAELLAKIAAGCGKVAQHLGTACAQYRAGGTTAPIAAGNFVTNLTAYFAPADKLQERPEWFGSFDYSGTEPGDYLVTNAGIIYFIAAQTALAPLLCVQTNAVVTLMRPVSMVTEAGGYNGVLVADAEILLSQWPVSLVASGRGKSGEVPDDDGLGAWVILLPVLPVVPMVADLLTDNCQRTFVTISVERTSLGWELRCKQVSS